MNEPQSVESTETTESTESTEETRDELISRLVGDEPESASPAATEGQKPVPAGQKKEWTVSELEGLAKAGKFSAVLDALGISRSQMDIPAKRYIGLNKKIRAAKEAEGRLAQSSEAQRAELAAQEVQFRTHVQALHDEYAPLAEAKKAVERGDYSKAINLISGGKLTPLKFAELMAEEGVSSDPVARRKILELEAQREADKKEKEKILAQQKEHQEAMARQEAAAQETRGFQALSGILTNSADPDLVRVAQHPLFLRPILLAVRREMAAGWAPDDETLKSQVIAYSKHQLLALRKETAILHGGSTEDPNQPAGEQAAETPRGNRGPIRRATPKLSVPPSEETRDQVINRLLAEANL